jgi:endoglucanase
MNRIIVLVLLSLLLSAFPAAADILYAGVNLSGAEFGMTHLPGTFGTDYTYPTSAEVDYYKSKGMNFIRLPFRWERLQHTNSAGLDATELSRMNTFVSYATARGVYVLLDPHNFMRYYPNPAGSYETATNGLVGSSVPNSDFSNFWFRVAAIYRTNSHVFFGLNNEPDTMPETQLVNSENAAIAGIRAAGATNLIFVPGNRWTGAWTWSQADGNGAANAVAMLGIVDPGSNYLFEVHQYLDSDGSGSHTTIVSADVGWERLTNFTAWARSNNFKGFLGEYAVPGAAIGGTNIGGLALTNMLSYIQTNSDVWLGWSYWGGGPWWGSTPLFPIEPTNIGQPTQMDQPVMGIIKQFFPLPVPTLQVVNRTQFQFNTAQGFIYQPQTSPTLAPGSWTTYGPSFPGTGGSTNINMQTGTLFKAWYRAQVSHAP